MNSSWLWVFLGGLLETVWATTMSLSDGFTDLPYVVVTLVFLILSTLCLNKGLKSGLPVGPCYAVWVGIGAIGSVIVDVVIFGHMLNLIGWGFLAILIIGVLGLNMVSEE